MEQLIKANRQDKKRVIEILSKAFDHDPHINWFVGRRKGRGKRMLALMEFVFEKGYADRLIFLTPGKQAVAVWRESGSRNMTFSLMKMYVKFIWVFGFRKIMEIDKLEHSIHSRYPKDKPYLYLWMLGADPSYQGKGLSSQLLRPKLAEADKKNLPVFLETTNPRNLPIYNKKGFQVYDEMILDEAQNSTIYFMQRAIQAA